MENISVRVLTDALAARTAATWKQEVRTVRHEMPDAVLVGGAIRDTYLGRVVKDRDYMTTSMAYAPGSLFETYIMGRRLRPCLMEAHRDANYETSGSLISAYETEDRSLNVLLVTSIYGRIQEFPDSLSQIWYDGDRVYCTAEFSRTLETGIVKCTDRMTEERVRRIKGKYPDYEFHRLDAYGTTEVL